MSYLANDENIKMKKEKKVEKKSILQKELNTKEILIGLGICGAVLIYGFTFIYPKYIEYKASVSELQGIEDKIASYNAKVKAMPELEDKLDSLKRELKVKSKMLSHNMEDGMFFIGLSKLMEDVYVNLVDYSMDEIIPYENFYAIPTSITVRGDYRHVREIMYYLEEQKNMTQVLDYNMKTYIPEQKEDTSTNNSDNSISTIVPDEHVHWTESGAAYHKEGCTVLEAEKGANGGNALNGSPSVSGKTAACQVCKPYSISSTNQLQTEPQKPKANGVVEATFKFIMYSSNNPILELENDDSSKWKPGKYNPFTSTI